MKTVEVAAVTLDIDTGAPVVVLREHEAPHRLLPLVVGASDAAAIALPATGQVPERPLTADLLVRVLGDLGAHVDNAEVTELRDGAFHAVLNLCTEAGTVAIDARPSDAIAVALRVDAPVFVSEHVLDIAGSLPPIETDAEVIEETVEEFREFLDTLDPDEFATETPPEPDPDDDSPDDDSADQDSPEEG